VEPLTLTNLLDDVALLSYEHQLHLADVLGDDSWSVNFDEQRLTFTGEGHSRTCTRLHFLGTAAPGPKSWLWSWSEMAQPVPEPLLAIARSVRDFGQRHQITELRRDEISFDELGVDPEEPQNAAFIMMEAAKAVSGLWASYNANAGRGTRVAFLIEHPDFRLPPPEPYQVGRVLREGVPTLNISDKWRAILSYAQHRQIDIQAADDRSRLMFTVQGYDFTAEFDEYGRVTQLGQHQNS
jgi:hypothetical protein